MKLEKGRERTRDGGRGEEERLRGNNQEDPQFPLPMTLQCIAQSCKYGGYMEERRMEDIRETKRNSERRREIR